MSPFKGGGDMILSVTFEKTTYNTIPHKFEAGTPPIAGAIGLGAAIDYLSAVGMDAIAAHELELLDYATEQMTRLQGVRIIGTAAKKAAVLSFVVDGVHPHDVGTLLNQEGIAVRTGHHCAQPVMQRFRVPATSRASFALYNSMAEVDALDRRHTHRAEGVRVMADPKSLYQEVILDHNRKPRNYGTLEHASQQAEGHNPLCGDRISVSVKIDGERIDGIAFEGESCAICKASASMMTVNVKGKTRADAEALIQEFRDMATGKLDARRRPPHRPAHGLRRRARPADARQMRDPPLAHAARRAQFGRKHVDRGRQRPDARADRRRLNTDRPCRRSPKSKPTPNPNALKFVLKEPLTWGIKRSYDNAAEAKNDPLAAALFDIGHVTNVFYIDNWLTVTQDGGVDWQELLRKIAEPIRAAPAASAQTAATVAAATAAIAELTPDDQQRLDMINALLDEHIRPYLQGDGGDLYVVGLEGNRLAVHYQGACGSCPSSISGTLAGIESLVKSIEPDIEVFAV